MKLQPAGQYNRAGKPQACRNNHLAAACCGTGFNRFAERFGVVCYSVSNGTEIRNGKAGGRYIRKLDFRHSPISCSCFFGYVGHFLHLANILSYNYKFSLIFVDYFIKTYTYLI
ncbi:hypothetical protein D3C75_1080000 [compost metagenome]